MRRQSGKNRAENAPHHQVGVTSRVYQAPLEVQSGYTVAIAGLDEATDSRSGAGLPVLSRIPVVGWAFKSRNRDRSRKNLMIFITPTIMPIDGNGVGERPISELPRYHGDEPVAPPRFIPTGIWQADRRL